MLECFQRQPSRRPPADRFSLTTSDLQADTDSTQFTYLDRSSSNNRSSSYSTMTHELLRSLVYLHVLSTVVRLAQPAPAPWRRPRSPTLGARGGSLPRPANPAASPPQHHTPPLARHVPPAGAAPVTAGHLTRPRTGGRRHRRAGPTTEDAGPAPGGAASGRAMFSSANLTANPTSTSCQNFATTYLMFTISTSLPSVSSGSYQVRRADS